MIASCPTPRPGVSSSSAPRKRQQSGMHSVNVLFLRPKSARISAVLASLCNVGDWRDALPVRLRAVLCYGFSDPPVPGTQPVRS